MAAVISRGPASLGGSRGSVLRPGGFNADYCVALFTASGLNGLGRPARLAWCCEPTVDHGKIS